jgi:hypothetical protein
MSARVCVQSQRHRDGRGFYASQRLAPKANDCPYNGEEATQLIRRYALTVSVLFLSLCALVRGGDVLSSSSGGFSLAWTAADIRITRAGNAAQQISFRRLAQAEWNKLTQGATGESLDFVAAYRVLSFVGPYLSVEVGRYCDCGGATPRTTASSKRLT